MVLAVPPGWEFEALRRVRSLSATGPWFTAELLRVSDGRMIQAGGDTPEGALDMVRRKARETGRK